MSKYNLILAILTMFGTVNATEEASPVGSQLSSSAATGSSEVEVPSEAERLVRFFELANTSLGMDLQNMEKNYLVGAINSVSFVAGLKIPQDTSKEVHKFIQKSDSQTLFLKKFFDNIFEGTISFLFSIVIESLESIDPESPVGLVRKYLVKLHFACYAKYNLPWDEFARRSLGPEISNCYSLIEKLNQNITSYKPFERLAMIDSTKLQELAELVRPYVASDSAFAPHERVIRNLSMNKDKYLTAPGAFRVTGDAKDVLTKLTDILPQLIPNDIVQRITLTKVNGARSIVEFQDGSILARLFNTDCLSIRRDIIEVPEGFFLDRTQKAEIFDIMSMDFNPNVELVFDKFDSEALSLDVREVTAQHILQVTSHGYDVVLITFNYMRNGVARNGVIHARIIRADFVVLPNWISDTPVPCTLNDLIWWNDYNLAGLALPGLDPSVPTIIVLQNTIQLLPETLDKLVEMYEWLDTRGADVTRADMIREINARGFEIQV